jgi:hypothetical protein
VKQIPLTRGKVALVDDDDYERVQGYHWQARPIGRRTKTWYAYTHIAHEYIFMHRFILQVAPQTNKVDHVDHDGLNNQKANLRIVTNIQNSQNKRKGSKNTSGYKGVTFHKRVGKRQSVIYIMKRCIYLGTFITAREAAIAYDKAATLYYGEFASLNFPEGQLSDD